jgi:hypothetical protein
LANDIVVQVGLDFQRRGQVAAPFAQGSGWQLIADDVIAQVNASSQMKTEGPAISFLTSCWLLPQKEQYSVFSLEFPFFSAMPWFT